MKLPEGSEYLGDGAHVVIEHGEIVLFTENGIEITNRVVLDLRMFEQLKRIVSGAK